MKKKIKFVHLSFVDRNLSGGDKIFLEYIKYIDFKKFEIDVLTNEFGYIIYINYLSKKTIDKINFIVTNNKLLLKLGKTASYPLRILKNTICSLFLKKRNYDIIISTSDFLTDLIPSIILKYIQLKKSKLLCSFFLKAPNPFNKNFPYKNYNFMIGFFYWITQFISIFFIDRFNNGIIICSNSVKKIFKTKKYLYIPGGVDYKFSHYSKFDNKKFDCCFYARFHPQKGPDEAIFIWSILAKKFNPHAKLIMIGDGPLFNKCKILIKNLKLENNIILKGYLHHSSIKEKIFKDSKLLIHPAIYDTGGMAALECMSFGIPAISYDLDGLKETYPIGMKKIKSFDRFNFAKSINDLINGKNRDYNKLRKESILLSKEWDWKKRYLEFEKYLSTQM